MDYKRISNDTNGNPRYVFHFLNFLSDKEQEDEPNGLSRISNIYSLAVFKAKNIGGKRYRGKDFGGGIVIQSYNIQGTINQIKELSK